MGSTGERYTEEFKHIIIEEYLAGNSFRKLAHKYSVSKGSISIWTKGLPRPNKPLKKPLSKLGPSPLDQSNSKKQGDVGLGLAIGWFTSRGYTVSIPLTDSQDYDLIVDDLGKLKRVQVKTTKFREDSGSFTVNLTVKGGNRTGRGKSKKLDPSKVDSIFILTATLEMYYIPVEVIGTKGTITLYSLYEPYLVSFQ